MRRACERTTRAGVLCAAVLAGLGGGAGAARADDFAWTRSEALVERGYRVRVVLEPGQATLTVRRTVYNGGERPDQATFYLDLPPEAVAVGLRTLGSAEGRPQWFGGELLEAETAAARYQELTGIGGYYPKDPALLSWRSLGRLALQVFPCMAQQQKVVEYTLAMPTHYRDGAYHVELPPLGSGELRAELTVEAAPGAGRVEVGAERFQRLPGTPAVVTWPADGGALDLALVPAHPPRLGGALGSLAASEAHGLTRFRFEAAPRLSEAPRGAHVVVVLDASRSIPEHEAAAALAAARGWLLHMPDARVEVLRFDREVRPTYGGFVPVARALADLAQAPVARRNGSAVDLALAAAAGRLAAVTGPKRIVLFTDALTRAAVGPARLQATLGAGALLHVVDVHEAAEASLARYDEHEYGELAAATGGVAWVAGAAAGAPDAALAPFEELARPVRLHALAIATERDDPTLFSPSELAEGQGVEHLSTAAHPQAWVAARGLLWTEPVRVRLEADPKESRRSAALVFGASAHTDFTEDEMMVLARAGGAVSPVTSYLAIEPGVRPSTEGLDHGRLASRRARPPQVRMGGTLVSGREPAFDPETYLRYAVDSVWLGCGGFFGRTARVALETTLDEVVDVTEVSAIDATAEELRCLRAGVWELALPDRFRDEHATFDVST
ncbi:MAG: hypothetical protein HY908_05595 [Myxococcales bacterium]|nr:hypothetical protein [Myxococcales bacterium]